MAFKHFAKGSIERDIDNELNRLNKQAVKLAKNGLHHSDTYNKVIWSMVEITGGYGNLNEKIIDGNIVYQAKRANSKLSEYASKKKSKEIKKMITRSKNITTWENIKKTANEYFEQSQSGYENASRTLENNPTAIISKYKNVVNGDSNPYEEPEDWDSTQEEYKVWKLLAEQEVEKISGAPTSSGFAYLIKETGEIVETYEQAIEEIRRLGTGYYDLLGIPEE